MYENAVRSALEAGKAILEIYELDFEVEVKADQSPLTAADKAAHAIIVQALETSPYPVLSEESGEIAYSDRKEWGTYWLVDPLDGTKEFIKKNGEFTVNIALIQDGVPVFGVVYAPVLDVIYCGITACVGELPFDRRLPPAWKASGCAGLSIQEILDAAVPLSIRDNLSSLDTRPLRVVASKSHCTDETRNFIAALENEYGDVELVSRGSSLKLCMVADGSADIYPRIAPTMEWDTGAAHAVVAAAGGRVFKYDPDIAPQAYKIASNADDSERGVTDKTLVSLCYNKENLLNPYFVVSGLRK